MSEVILKNKYLDFGGLQKYDELIKALIANGNAELADAIAALDAKIGSLEIEGSDDKTLSESIANIYTSISEIIETQGALETKDGELEGLINGIIGDLESLEEGVDAVMTLVQISNKLKTLDASVVKNAQDIAGVDTRLTTLEDTVEALGKIEGGETLGSIVNKVNTNESDIATLKGEGEGSVKKTAEDAANAAENAAKAYADGLASNYDKAGDAAQALTDAKAYADSLATNYDVAGSAETAAAGAEANAKAYADGLVNDEEGKSKFDAAGSAAQALEDAQAYADEKSGANAELIGGLSERIGSLEGIAKAANVVYDEDTKFINIVDAEGNKIGEGFDASPFIVDGMLDAVDFEMVDGVKTNNLVFTFNTAAGKESIKVDFTKYVDTYHADGSSIELNSATNTFSVKNVEATKTTLTSSIEVNGGPLANDSTESNDKWPEDWYENGVKVIPSGKSMEEILTSLFLKVTNGTVTKGSITWNPSLSAPSVSITQSGTVEVGTKLTATANTTNTVSSNTRSCTFTCKPGHFLSTGTDENGKLVFGSYVSGNKTVTANAVEPATSGSPSIKTYWNGEEVTNVNGTTEYTVSIVGTNTFKVDQSGVTAYAGAFDDITVYGSTNTKVPVESVKASITNDTAPTAKNLTSTNKAEVTGARAYWMGAMSTPLSEFTSATIREAGETSGSGLVKTLGASPATTLEVPAGKYDVVIATQKEVTSVISKAQGNFEIGGNFTKNHIEVNIEGANSFTAIKYHIYHCNANWDKDTLTISYK